MYSYSAFFVIAPICPLLQNVLSRQTVWAPGLTALKSTAWALRTRHYCETSARDANLAEVRTPRINTLGNNCSFTHTTLNTYTRTQLNVFDLLLCTHACLQNKAVSWHEEIQSPVTTPISWCRPSKAAQDLPQTSAPSKLVSGDYQLCSWHVSVRHQASRFVQTDSKSGDVICCLTGDFRVNEQTGLASMHNLFVLLHNFFERNFARINRHWNGERLFQVFT